jgi:hypothetical protein
LKKKSNKTDRIYQIIKPLEPPRESNKRIAIIEHPHNQQKTRRATPGALEEVLKEARFEGSGGLRAFCEAHRFAFYCFVVNLEEKEERKKGGK